MFCCCFDVFAWCVYFDILLVFIRVLVVLALLLSAYGLPDLGTVDFGVGVILCCVF